MGIAALVYYSFSDKVEFKSSFIIVIQVKEICKRTKIINFVYLF